LYVETVSSSKLIDSSSNPNWAQFNESKSNSKPSSPARPAPPKQKQKPKSNVDLLCDDLISIDTEPAKPAETKAKTVSKDLLNGLMMDSVSTSNFTNTSTGKDVNCKS